MKRCLIGLIFGKRQQVVIRVGNGEFGSAVKCFLQAVDEVDFALNGVEERTDLADPDIEQQGAAVLAADHREGVAEALKGLEHKADVAAADHGPVKVAVCFCRDGHNKIKSEEFIEFNGGSDVSDEEIGGEGVHMGKFFSNILKKLANKIIFLMGWGEV